MAKHTDMASKISIFDSHHRMERFGIMFVAFVVLLLSLFGMSYKINVDKQKVNLGVRAMYTERSQWSLTGQYAQVLNIYRDDNFSKVFILVKTGESSADMSTLSTSATDYQMFLTGYNGDTITKTPDGAVYMFGNTGYMGLYFADASGFDAHLYDIVVRCNKNVTSDVNQTAQENYANNIDKSYLYHNQIHIYANFAGSEAPVADFLNKENASVEEIYADVVAVRNETGVRSTLDETLTVMNNDIHMINEYESRLKALGVSVPALPAALDGDKITYEVSETENNPTCFDKSMINPSSSIIGSSYYSSSVSVGEGISGVPIEHTTDEVNTKLYLVTDYVFPGGYQYNYQTMKLVDNNLEGLKPNDLTFAQWVEQKKIEKQTYRTISQTLDQSYYNTWYKDGVEFTYDESGLDIDAAVNTAIKDYVTAVNQLYSHKYVYQTQSLYDLLKLEASTKTSTSLFSINANDNVLVMY